MLELCNYNQFEMWSSKFKQNIPFTVMLLEVKQSRVILQLKLVKLVVYMHLFSYKLWIVFLCLGNTQILIWNHIFLKCHTVSFTHEMIYNFKCCVLQKKNGLDRCQQSTRAENKDGFVCYKKNFLQPPNFGKHQEKL